MKAPPASPASPVKSPPPARQRATTARKDVKRMPPVPRRALTIDVIDLEPESDTPLVAAPASSLDVDQVSARVRAAEMADTLGTPARLQLDESVVAGDPDADLNAAYSTGDEAPGGDNPTPDQDVVDLIGRSLGVTYEDDEELQGGEEITDRDRHRWELDPASADDFKDRSRE